MASQNCWRKATRIVVTSDESFIQDVLLDEKEDVSNGNLGIVESIADHHAAAVQVQKPGGSYAHALLGLCGRNKKTHM